MFASRFCERIKPRLAVVARDAPLRRDPSVLDCCPIARAIPCPCWAPKSSVRKISRSSVPCSSGIRSFSWVAIRPDYETLRVECQPERRIQLFAPGSTPAICTLRDRNGVSQQEIIQSIGKTPILGNYQFTHPGRLVTGGQVDGLVAMSYMCFVRIAPG